MDNKGQMASLLQRGISPNLTDSQRGETALMMAVREDSMKVFALLLNARGINLNIRARNGDTALMVAAFKKNKPAVEALLAHGAEVNQPGWTALHYAAFVGSNEIVQLLLDKSADVNAVSPNKTTPVMMAAHGGHIYTVKMLLDAGADASQQNDLGMTALTFAQQFGHEDIAEGLLHRKNKAQKKAADAADAATRATQVPVLIRDGRLPQME